MFGKIFILLIVLLTAIPISGQTREVLMLEASKAWSQSDFAEASWYYREAFRLDSADLFCAFRLAESYRLDNGYAEAAEMYRHVISMPEAEQLYPEAWFQLAMMTKQKGDYKHFCTLLEDYLRIATDPEMRKRAGQERAFCNEMTHWENHSLPVRITHLGRSVNTPYSEFAASQFSDSLLIFSALRPTSLSEFQSFSAFDYRTAIYSSMIRVSGFQEGKELNIRINRKNTHNANLVFDKGKSRAFFSRCTDMQNGRMECHIMASNLHKGKWGKPLKLTENINLPGFTDTQPHFSTIEDAGVLYFVSNRPGGFGGMDIWYTIESDGIFSKPVNCGSIINTPGNEVTPFYDIRRNRLFFSSDWHTGYGGYDILYADGGLASWEKVKNIGQPINSPANDYYFSVNPSDSNGYFTSNRTGSFHLRGETCCNDIYAYEWIPEQPASDTIFITIPETPDTIQELARRLLPLILFFHNDEPDAATMNITSSKDFKKALDEYVGMKELYRREYARGLRTAEAQKAMADIEDFFDSYVLNGYEKLEMLTGFLIEDLQAGNSVQLLVSGFCSPLSTNEYNINLARRRIHSLVKYLETVQDGILKPYMEASGPDEVKLMIFEDPVGKEKASPFVSDNPNDLRNSVYSRSAAFERRIEISMYVSGKSGEMPLLSELPRFTTPMGNIHLDPFSPGERRVISIPYKNEGKSELLIRNVEFNGEKVWVEWSNEPLLPGRESKLLVLVNPGNTTETFKEDIRILTNLPEPFILTISGDVREK